MVHKALNEGSAGEALQRERLALYAAPGRPSMKAALGRRCNEIVAGVLGRLDVGVPSMKAAPGRRCN